MNTSYAREYDKMLAIAAKIAGNQRSYRRLPARTKANLRKHAWSLIDIATMPIKPVRQSRRKRTYWWL